MRRFALLACLLFAAVLRADPPEPASVRVAGQDYVSVEEVARILGLKVERLENHAVLLKDGARPVLRMTDKSREIDLKGLRLFLGEPVESASGVLCVSRIDYRYRLVPRLRPGLCLPLPPPPRVVVVDPGHGGADQGTSNPSLGTNEKTYTLDVALRLKKLLEGAGHTVILTRDSDVDIPKALRPEIANRAGADLFVSIHFNSLYPNTTSTGAEVLTFPPRTQRSTDSWSKAGANDAEAEEVPGNHYNAWNTILAGAVHRHLVDTLKNPDRGEKLAHLAVLRGIRCPAVLVESAMLSSDKEGALLKTPEFRDKIAQAVFEGIEDYAAMVRPAGISAPAGAAPASPGPAAAPAPTGAPVPLHAVPTRPSAP
jgi:N-acetylmuramoyl-L-alanine amidase